MNKKISHRVLSLSLIAMLVMLLAPAGAQLGITPTDPRISAPATPDMFPEASAVLMMDDIKFDVLPDGTHTFEEHDAIKVLTQEGIEENASLVRMVDTSKSEVEILMARTIKADGKILDAGEPRYSPLAEGSEVYKSVQRFSLSFPEVEAGDTSFCSPS